MQPAPFVLCLASYFKGARFLQELKRQGCRVLLLTQEALQGEAWPWESIDEVFYLPAEVSQEDLVKSVSYLARTREFDRMVALDDYDVERVAALREHTRTPGMGDSTVRFFRDKLAMRRQAEEAGILVPRFEHALNHARLQRFMDRVPPPWVLKPRAEAGAVGIKKLHAQGELWPWLEQLGDEQSHRLLEEYVPGVVCHVDSLVWEGEIVFSVAHRYLQPPFNVWNDGGIFGSRSLLPEEPWTEGLHEVNREVLRAFRLARGVTHAEFIVGEADQRIYFLEVAARVGGAHLDDLIEAGSGINLWEEWARLEVAHLRGERYAPPRARHDAAGLLLCLARQARPDLSAYRDPEVVWRLDAKAHHAGLVVQSPSPGRVAALLESYRERFSRDFLAIAPPTEKALH